MNGSPPKHSRRPHLSLIRGEAGQAYRPCVAVVIPCFNEEKNIEKVLLEVRALAARRPRWRILPVVVNDGSTDRSAFVLNRIAPQYGAAFVNLPVNLGIGGAVQAGFRYAVAAGADVTLQLDGDGQHPAGEIPVIVGPVLAGKCDVAVGSRYVGGGGGNVSSTLRQAGTRFFSILLRVISGAEIRDTTSGFRAFNREASHFLARYYPDDYPEVEAYVPLARRGFRIQEVPVTMRKREHGASSITPLRSIYYMVKVAFAAAMQALRKLPARQNPDPPEAAAASEKPGSPGALPANPVRPDGTHGR